MPVTLVFREPEFYNVFRSPVGPVGRYLGSRGQLVKRIAQALAGSRTGALRSSIHTRHLTDSRGQYIKIGTQGISYALMHHEGTRPHMIYPKRASVLRFVKRGQIVYAHSVMHPGTRPNKFLTNALKVTPGISGFRLR